MFAFDEVKPFGRFKTSLFKIKYKKALSDYYFTVPGLKFDFTSIRFLSFKHVMSNYQKILFERNKYEGKRCFIIGGGPSLKQMDLTYLKNEHVIAVNSSFKILSEIGIEPDFLMIEDVKSAYNIAKAEEYRKLQKTQLLVGIHNSYLKFPSNTVYFKTNYPADLNYYFTNGVSFSTQFEHISYLGGTIIYLALQYAFHLGFKEVYLLGVDFSYGKRFEEKFSNKQGEVVILDSEDIEILKTTHFSNSYLQYKIGDKMNIPHWTIQKSSFIKAREIYNKNNRKLYNAGLDSELDVLEKIDFNSLFIK